MVQLADFGGVIFNIIFVIIIINIIWSFIKKGQQSSGKSQKNSKKVTGSSSSSDEKTDLPLTEDLSGFFDDIKSQLTADDELREKSYQESSYSSNLKEQKEPIHHKSRDLQFKKAKPLALEGKGSVKPGRKKKPPHFLKQMKKEGWKHGIIISEVLGPCVAKRKR